MNNKKTVQISILVLLLTICGLFLIKNINDSKKIQGDKNVIITVVNESDNYKKEHKCMTSATTLTELLNELQIANFQDSSYGSYIIAVDDYKADESKQQWWKITINGHDSETGADSVIVHDNDKYELILMEGY